MHTTPWVRWSPAAVSIVFARCPASHAILVWPPDFVDQRGPGALHSGNGCHAFLNAWPIRH
eukprot:8614038-Lingulodinium_polyedra.AAC.1